MNNPVRADFVPKTDYTCRDFARAEKDRLWNRVWQVAAREQDLARVGDYVTYDICDRSIIVVRSAPDTMVRYIHLINDTLHAITTEKDAAAATRLMSEASASDSPVQEVAISNMYRVLHDYVD